MLLEKTKEGAVDVPLPPPSLISLMVSVNVKRPVYLLTVDATTPSLQVVCDLSSP